MIVIEQKPHDATVIIDKEDLKDIIVFLNNTNDSEKFFIRTLSFFQLEKP